MSKDEKRTEYGIDRQDEIIVDGKPIRIPTFEETNARLKEAVEKLERLKRAK